MRDTLIKRRKTPSSEASCSKSAISPCTVSASASFFSLDAHPADLTVSLDSFRPFAGFLSAFSARLITTLDRAIAEGHYVCMSVCLSVTLVIRA